MVRFFNKYFELLLSGIEPDDNRRVLADGFRWTSICVNQNLCCKKHRDRNNEGMSAITALGPFTGGGRLKYWEDDLGAGHGSAHDLPDDKAMELRTFVQASDLGLHPST